MAIPDRGLDLPWYSWGDVPFNGPLTDFDLDPPFQPHSFTHVTPDTSFRGGLSTSQGIDGSLVNAQSSIVEPTYHHVEGSALAVVAPEDGNTNAGGDPYNPGGLFIQSSSYNETQKVPYIHPAHTSLPVPPLFNSGLSIAEVNLQQKGVTAVYDKPYLTQSWMEQSPEYHFSSQQSARLSSPPMNAQAFGVSRLPAERFASPQYPVHQLLQSQHHGYTTVDDFDPNLLAAPIVSYPLSPYALTGERYQSYAPPHSTGPLPSRNQTMREIYSSVGEQREEVRSITALPWSSGPHSIDNELLPPNDWVNDNVAPSGDFGMHILRTSSPEHFHTEAHVQPGPSSSFPIRALHSRRAQILHRDSMVGLETSESARSTMVARGSSGSESFGTISSRPSASGSSGSSASWRPSPQHSIGESPNRTRTRIKPSDKAKEKTRELRNSKTVCEHCIQAHKKCRSIFEGPCPQCLELTGNQLYLGRAMCYRRGVGVEDALKGKPDVFGIAQRQASIQPQLESMHDDPRSFLLGAGPREHGKVLYLEIDLRDPLLVKIQDIIYKPVQPMVSTGGHETAKDDFETKSYGIAPEFMPSHERMDEWARQNIESQAEKWSDNGVYHDSEATIDLILLRYLRFSQQAPWWHIVRLTLRIVNLGRFTGSRRPIDLEEGLAFLRSFKTNPPKHFGIVDYNKAKEKFQLSHTAREQLHVHAALGIEEAEKDLGKLIDAVFQHMKEHTNNVLMVGICLWRLALDYRQRLERYRCFPANSKQLQERMEGCEYMYTLYTRLYALLYSDYNNIPPQSPKWDVENFDYCFGENAELIMLIWNARRLEKDSWCNSRPRAL